MYWTHLNHVAWPQNFELRLGAWKQRLSSLRLQGCFMWKRGTESYEYLYLWKPEPFLERFRLMDDPDLVYLHWEDDYRKIGKISQCATYVLHVEMRARNEAVKLHLLKSHRHTYWTHLNHVAWPQNLRFMIGSMKTKVVVKFEASGMLHVETRANYKATKCVHFAVHVKISSLYALNTPQPHRLTTKFRVEIGSMETKDVVKFEASEMLHVQTRARKLWNVYISLYMLKSHSHMYWTHLNHVTWPRNLDLWSVAWKQRLWSSLRLQGCFMWKRGQGCFIWKWGTESY